MYRMMGRFRQTQSLYRCILMIKSLYQIGEQEKATELFENVLSHANHLGLFSEYGLQNKTTARQFPQGYSHIALIDAA